jgi:hypothetical protein
MSSYVLLRRVALPSVHRLLVTANVVPISPVLVTMIMEALGSSEMSVITRATRRNNPEDGILHFSIAHNFYACLQQFCFEYLFILKIFFD